MLDKLRFELIELKSWQEFLSWYGEFSSESDFHDRRWIFRGEKKVYPRIAPTLEREARDSDIPFDELRERESGMLNEFKRRLHHYTHDTPHPGDLAEWLSLMRHYEAPTRLLDWSYSPFVAAFFAIENAHNKPCVIWAIQSKPYTSRELIESFNEEEVDEYFESNSYAFIPEESKTPHAALLKYLIDHPRPELQVVNPFRMSERATIQKSVHLIPGDLSISYEQNMMAHAKDTDGLTKICIEVNPASRKDFIFHLYRMNIDRSTLFPGLQGFAKSLQTRLVIPEVLSK